MFFLASIKNNGFVMINHCAYRFWMIQLIV